MRLKILNWNVWSGNTNVDDALNFLASAGADIICLQEAPAALVERLGSLSSYVLIQAVDAIHRQRFSSVPNYLVILVRNTVTITRTVCPHFKKRRRSNLLARLFGMERTLLALFLGWYEGIQYQYVDIRINNVENSREGRGIRIFNAHLSSAVGPRTRRRQFAEILKCFDEDKTNIFCGDLNVLILKRWWGIFPRLALFDSWSELWERECEKFQEMFLGWKLRSACDEEITHEATGCHLDYILTPDGVSIVAERVFPHTCGSDHKPLCVEIEI